MHSNRLLVIEDDPRIANLICHVAVETDFVTCIATGPQSIIKAYTNWHPDVIALDILMPDMDGIEVVRFLHQQSSKARIVLISGSGGSFRRMTESFATSMGLTIDANISKPFQLDEVRNILEKIKKSLDERRRPFGQDHGNHH